MKRAIVFALILSLCFTGVPYSVQAAGIIISEESVADGRSVVGINSESRKIPDMPVGGWEPTEMHYTEQVIPETDEDAPRYVKNIINLDTNSVFSKGSGHMGYDALDSDAKKSFYLRINDAAIGFMQSETDLEITDLGYGDSAYIIDTVQFSDLGLSLNDAYQTFVAYDYDHPAYYWISNSVWYTGSSIMMRTEQEYAAVSAREIINSQIESGVREIEALVDSLDDVYDKILLVHDKIVTDIDYAYESNGYTPKKAKWAHSVQGVFDPSLRGAVCEGYADSFSLVMNYLGLPNYYIVGTAGQGGAGGGGGHAWNAVSADGGETFMYMDLTWDDLGEENGYFYKYFGMPKSDFEKTHFAYTSSGEMAKWLYDIDCVINDSLEKAYYYIGNRYFDGGEAGTFAKTIDTGAHRFGNVLTFLGSSLDNLEEVVYELGYSDYWYYNVSYKGTEYYIFAQKTLDKTDISGAMVILSQESYDFEGIALEPIPKVVCDGINLIKDLNYTLSYSNNAEPGNAKLIVNGCGNFYGEAVRSFVIEGQGVSPEPTITPGPTGEPTPTEEPTSVPKIELCPDDFWGVEYWGMEDDNGFLYRGTPIEAEFELKDDSIECGNITVYYSVPGLEDWTNEAPVNAGIYMVAIDIEGSEQCMSANKLRADNWMLEIVPVELEIVPDEGLWKEEEDPDPEFTFTYTGDIPQGEVPKFTGSLSRAPGEKMGEYLINLGSLKLVDNEAFLAANYCLVYDGWAYFEICGALMEAPEIYVISKTKHSIVLGWYEIEKADGYVIEYEDGVFSTSEVTYELTGLLAGTVYNLYVYAYKHEADDPDRYTGYHKEMTVSTEPKDILTADDFIFEAEDVYYDGLPHGAVVTPKNPAVEIEIRYSCEEPYYWAKTAPTELGTYVVSLYVEETDDIQGIYGNGLSDDSWQFTIKPCEIVPGDIDGDGVINAKDVTMLRRYLAGGWNVTVNLANADVDGDGTINAKDVTILRRYLADGWGVELGKQ